MRNFKSITITLAIMASLLFVACDDKDDNKQGANTCAPASCAMAENATEMGCSDAGACIVKTCADKFKVADDAKSCVADTASKCDPACNADTEDCKCSDPDAEGKVICTCETKPAVCKCDDGTDCPKGGKDACAKPATTCDPACNSETEECKCGEADADGKVECKCETKTPAEQPAEVPAQ